MIRHNVKIKVSLKLSVMPRICKANGKTPRERRLSLPICVCALLMLAHDRSIVLRQAQARSFGLKENRKEGRHDCFWIMGYLVKIPEKVWLNWVMLTSELLWDPCRDVSRLFCFLKTDVRTDIRRFTMR